MHWKRKGKKNLNGAYSKFSISKKLKQEGKSSDEFEFYIGRLSLEELIALKLEVTARILGGKLYGFNLLSAMPKIAKDAAILYAISVANTTEDAATMLNMNTVSYFAMIDKYKSNKYFQRLMNDLTEPKE